VARKRRLDFRRQAPIRVGDLQFELEIGHGPQTTQDDGGAGLPGVVDGEAIEAADFHRTEMERGPADLFKPLLKREAGLLGRVAQHRHHQAIEEAIGPLDQVEMAQGEGVEAAGGRGPSSSVGGRAVWLKQRPATGPDPMGPIDGLHFTGPDG